MTTKEKKNKTIRVTDTEKIVIDLYRDISKNDYETDLLYKKSCLINNEIVYSSEVNFIIEELKKDELLESCYNIAKEEIGENAFYRKFSMYTNSLIFGAFQKNIDIDMLNEKTKEKLLNKKILKDTIEYIYCIDKKECLNDIKEYLIKYYGDKAEIALKEKQDIVKKRYIPITIKDYQIPIYLQLTKGAKDYEEDMYNLENNYKFYNEYNEYNTEMKEYKINKIFYEELINIFESNKNTFTMNIHAKVLQDIFLSIVESEIDSAENQIQGIQFSILKNIDTDIKMPNKSPRALKKEGIIIRNIHRYIKEVINSNKKICNYYKNNYEYILKDEPLIIVDKSSIKTNKMNLSNKRSRVNGSKRNKSNKFQCCKC